MINWWCMNGGYSLGIGKSEKHIISLLVLITVDLYTELCLSSSVKYQSPPMESSCSKQTGSKPSSLQHFMLVRPLAPAPIIATLIF